MSGAAPHQKGYVLDIYERIPKIDEPLVDVWISEAVLNAPCLVVYVEQSGGGIEGVPCDDAEAVAKELERSAQNPAWEPRYVFVEGRYFGFTEGADGTRTLKEIGAAK